MRTQSSKEEMIEALYKPLDDENDDGIIKKRNDDGIIRFE